MDGTTLKQNFLKESSTDVQTLRSKIEDFELTKLGKKEMKKCYSSLAINNLKGRISAQINGSPGYHNQHDDIMAFPPSHRRQMTSALI